MSSDGNNSAAREEIEIAVGPRTARRLNELAWSYGIERKQLIETFCEKAAERTRH